MSLRKDIRQAAVALIDGIPSLTGRTHDTRFQTVDNKPTSQPAAIVATLSEVEEDEVNDMGEGCLRARITRLTVELFALGNNEATVAALLDDLEDSVSTELNSLFALFPDGILDIRMDALEMTMSEETGEFQGLMMINYLIRQR